MPHECIFPKDCLRLFRRIYGRKSIEEIRDELDNPDTSWSEEEMLIYRAFSSKKAREDHFNNFTGVETWLCLNNWSEYLEPTEHIFVTGTCISPIDRLDWEELFAAEKEYQQSETYLITYLALQAKLLPHTLSLVLKFLD